MFIILLGVSGCGLFATPSGDTSPPVTSDAVSAPGDIQRPQARPDRGADTQTPDLSVGTLGRTVASLGNAAEPGLWMKTPLVDSERQARVFSPQTQKSVAVTLIPIDGPDTAGSRLSLAAMQALGVSLGDLVEVEVFGA